MKNVHVIPTDKPSRLYKVNNKLYFEEYPDKAVNAGNQHIYITNDEEIKEGDWVLCGGISLLKVKKEITYDAIKLTNKDFETKKIILTTDQDLIADGVKQISEEYLLEIIKDINNG